MDDSRAPVADALTAITAALVDEPEVATVLELITEACVGVLGVDSAGVMVTDPRGGVEVLAATDEHATLIEVLQSQIGEGPCVDCIGQNSLIVELDLTQTGSRWPRFTPIALAAGYRAVVAVPMRLHTLPIGGLNLLFSEPPSQDPATGWWLHLARALADLSVLALVQDRVERRPDHLLEHTLRTINDQAHLSQAAGMVVAAAGLDPHQARRAVRDYARHTRRPLRETVRAITDNHLDPLQIARPVSPVTATEPDD